MTPGHHVGTRSLVLTAALLLAGCGATSHPTTPAPHTTTGPPLGRHNPESAYGAVCSATWPAAVGTNSSPGPGDPISKGDTITTMPGGDIDFWIRDKIKSCEIFNNGRNNELTVWPATGTPQVLIQVTAGAVTCSTHPSGGVRHLRAGHHAQLSMTDPDFAILIAPDGSVTIQVAAGTLTVGTDTGQSPVTVPAHMQVTVAPDGHIGALMPFILEKQSKAEQAAIQRVQSAVMPSPGT